MAVIGYVRVSTTKQTTDQQREALEAFGCDRIFEDITSGARDDRKGLTAVLDYCRPGDTLVVWRLDRLGRSLSGVVRAAALEQLTEGDQAASPASDSDL